MYGNANLSCCTGSCYEDVDKHGASQLVLDLYSLEYEVEAEANKNKKTIKVPEEVSRVFIGSFGSSCYHCDLRLRTDDDNYTLLFSTDLEAAWERIEGHGMVGRSMLLSIFKGEDILAEFTFGSLSVNRLSE